MPLEMVQKNSQQLLQEFNRAGKGNSQFSRVNLGDYDDYEDDDGDDQPEEDDQNNSEEIQNNIPPILTAEEELTKQGENLAKRTNYNEEMPPIVIVMLFIEKFVDITVVFLFTLLAILWKPLRMLLRENFWCLIVLGVILIVTLALLYRVQWCRRFPGCFVYKLVYLHFLSTMFFILAIHFPIALSFLSSYFALIAAATVGTTYILFSIVSVTHKHFCKIDAKGCTLWKYGFLTPIFILVISQPIFLCMGTLLDLNYVDYIANVGGGVVMSLPFIYETLFIYHRFVNTKELQEFVQTTGLLPGFVTATFSKQLERENSGDTEKKLCRV